MRRHHQSYSFGTTLFFGIAGVPHLCSVLGDVVCAGRRMCDLVARQLSGSQVPWMRRRSISDLRGSATHGRARARARGEASLVHWRHASAHHVLPLRAKLQEELGREMRIVEAAPPNPQMLPLRPTPMVQAHGLRSRRPCTGRLRQR